MCATPYRLDRVGSRLPPWVAVALVTIVCRLPAFFRTLLDDDEAQYAAIGELVRSGAQLYGDGGVDFKPPGIYWTYAAVFGASGRYAMWAMHAVALLVVVATACMLAAIAARIADRRAGVLAGVFYGVFTTVYYPKMLAANTEIFMMLALSAMTLLVMRAREAPRTVTALAALAGGGALVAIASGYKQSAALNLAVIAAGVIATRAWLLRLIAAGAGFAAMLGIGALVVAATSSLPAMWHWCVTQVVGKYGAGAWHGSVWHNIAVGLLPFIASSLLVWIAGAARFARIRAAHAPERIVWVWFAISLASSFAGGHFFGHYFIQPLAPLSVLAALEIDRWLARPGRAAVRSVWALTAIPAAGFFAFNLAFEPITESFGAPDPDFRGPVAWVRSHTQRDDRIFVWGNFAPMYVLADRLPASRFVGFMRGAERNKNVPPEVGWDTGPEVWPALAEDFARHPPAVVIDTSTADYMSFGNYPIRRFPQVAALLQHYRVAAVVDRVTMYVPGDPALGGK